MSNQDTAKANSCDLLCCSEITRPKGKEKCWLKKKMSVFQGVVELFILISPKKLECVGYLSSKSTMVLRQRVLQRGFGSHPDILALTDTCYCDN